MRGWLGVAALALVALGPVAGAQTAGDPSGTAAAARPLPELQRSLMQASERLREAPQGDGTDLGRAAAAANDVLAALREQVAGLPRARRAGVEAAVQKAQQTLEGGDPAAMAAALEEVRSRWQEAALAGEDPAAGKGAGMAQQPASAAERQTLDEQVETPPTRGLPADTVSSGQPAAGPQAEALQDPPAATAAQQARLAGMSVEEIVGQSVYSSAGEEIGSVGDVVVRDRDQSAALVGGGGWASASARSPSRCASWRCRTTAW